MKKSDLHTVIIILGPTAVGKTGLSVSLADHFKTEIISADSRQCYKELNIGVAKPSSQQLEQVKHYFINSHSINEEVNAGSFEILALAAADKIFQHNIKAVMVGGTGLYIRSFCEGMDEMPKVEEATRKKIISSYEEEGMVWLQNEVQKNDPVFWETAEQQNPHRLMRALEIFYTTGRSISSFHQNKKTERPFNIIKIGLELSKEHLHKNINERVDQMMIDGLELEAESLLPYRKLNALQTVGYKELSDHFDGKCSLKEAVEQIKTNTRQYAKRQMTWFKKDKDVNWYDASGISVEKLVKDLLKDF